MAKEDEILTEIKQIREALVSSQQNQPEKKKDLFEDSIAYVKSHRVMELAIAIILGIFLFILFFSLIYNVLFPVIEIFIPELLFEMRIGPIQFGAFLRDLIAFHIVVVLIILLIKVVRKMGIE
jgi:large-conductance mechanosensitive channel